jgi:hypothetical protein
MIKTWEEYNQLESLCDAAEDKLISGEGEIGQHYALANILRRHGVFSISRYDTIPLSRKLLSDFMDSQKKEGEK